MNIIIPMAGRSSRFAGTRPKWMLTHPNGRFMVCEAITGLNLNDCEKIIFVYLKEHEEQYHFIKGFREELEEIGLLSKTELIGLDKQTRSQPETVYQAIKLANISGAIFIKDCDNRFCFDIYAENFVCYYDLSQVGLIKPKNKSYIIVDSFGRIVNIIEKQVISPYFCVGGYGFKDAKIFTDTLEQINLAQEVYVSNIIYQRLLEKDTFEARPVTNYLDWGTWEDWERFRRSYATLFVDLDGVIFEHSSCHFPPYYGETGGITENVEIVKQLRKSGKFQIVIATSRPERYRDLTIRQLESLGIEYDSLLMGLYHAKRIIINDYSKSNPYKSCDAINLKRNSQELKEILRESLGIDYEEI